MYSSIIYKYSIALTIHGNPIVTFLWKQIAQFASLCSERNEFLQLFLQLFCIKRMDMKMTNKVSCDKVGQADRIINDVNPDKNVTEEEFQNFMQRVTEVGK